jgi:hypothetical protein
MADPQTTPDAALAATYCGRCGDDVESRTHQACLDALQLEPPRYCALCRRRMTVQVTPDGWSARCVEHGARTARTWGQSDGVDEMTHP